MALERFLHEDQSRILIALPGHEALEKLALLVDRAPQVDHLAVQLHVQLIKVPAPLPEAAHLARSLTSDVACEQRPEPVPPHPYRLIAQIDPALEQQVFYISKAERVFHLHHHHEADHLGRGVEAPERARRIGSGFAAHLRWLAPQCRSCHIALTEPSRALNSAGLVELAAMITAGADGEHIRNNASFSMRPFPRRNNCRNMRCKSEILDNWE